MNNPFADNNYTIDYNQTTVPNGYFAGHPYPDLTLERVSFITKYVLSAQARGDDTEDAVETAKKIWVTIVS